MEQVRAAAAKQAKKHAFTPMIGRSHGIHAEPTTFGLKMALMYDEFGRALARLKAARETVRVGKLSGAVGTHAHLDPKIEAAVCRKLGLRPAAISTQILQRDRHAEFVAALALVGDEHRTLGAGVPPPAAHRGARGGGILRQGPEGLQRDAAQEESRSSPSSSAGWRGCCAAMP